MTIETHMEPSLSLDVTAAVVTAIQTGYRHIDGAYAYQNQKEVGAGIRQKIEDGTVKRQDLFVVSKVKLSEIFQLSHRLNSPQRCFCNYSYGTPLTVQTACYQQSGNRWMTSVLNTWTFT